MRATMPLVVVEALMSMSTGAASVGKPTAIGLGVYRPAIAPWGATAATAGSEHVSSIIRPRSVARFGYAVRHAMGCARRDRHAHHRMSDEHLRRVACLRLAESGAPQEFPGKTL